MGRGQGEGGKTEEVWLLVITALPAAAYNSSIPLPSLLTTHPAPYLRTAAPQSPPFSNHNHSPAVPSGCPSTSTASNPISNPKPFSLPGSPLTPVCLAALRSLLPICAPVCVPPAPTLCQQHHTTARETQERGMLRDGGEGWEEKREMDGGEEGGGGGGGEDGSEWERDGGRRERGITRLGAWRMGTGAKESGREGKGGGLWVEKACMNSQGMGGGGDGERLKGVNRRGARAR
ncbi:hypothetical protein EYF80_006159 [Liparis tanakae]|uniref:Uncharacterized protein n=1 Tax=Liparis tanakae TaxID=230148 RepID=A0A4Z2J118_9TELE|nr:hypothetical protein EYF80_006159 [Liparis tanakae]